MSFSRRVSLISIAVIIHRSVGGREIEIGNLEVSDRKGRSGEGGIVRERGDEVIRA